MSTTGYLGTTASAVKVCFLFCAVQVVCAADDIFYTPDILKGNVAFWKKIYTEVSLTEGLLHDRDYPMVIYRKVSIGRSEGRQRESLIKTAKADIQLMLEHISSQPESSWTAEEKNIAAMFEKHAGGREALTAAAERIRFQQGQKERFYEGLYRSGMYIDTIRSILAQYDVPQELAWLPHVESSFNHHAYSRVGAAGLWQFMRSTGKLYLKIDYDIDERLDPIASTYAAAKLLSHNYRELQAWPIAITAYNHGLNGMKRAVAATGSRDIAVIIQRHESPSFKFASKNFYGCFLAVCDIAREPSKYFSEVKYAPPVRCTDMVLSHNLQPAVLARSVGIDETVLAALNPAIRPVVFRQQKHIPQGTRIHLPQSMSPSYIDSALAMVPKTLKLDTLPETGYYRVSKGDNLSAIARRFGVPVAALAEENGIGRASHIYAGQILRIPGAAVSEAREPVLSFVEDKRPEMGLAPPQAEQKVTGQPEPLQETHKEKTPAAATSAAAVHLQAAPVESIPDTLKEAALARADEPAPEIIDALKGQQQGRFDADVYHLEVEISPVGNAASIRVSVDETIGHYAEWLGVAQWRIRQLNRLGNHSVIHIGQRLTIPGDTATIKRFVEKRLEYHMALEEDFYGQYKVAEVREHIIKRGESLWTLSTDESGEIPLWLLQKYNKHLDFARLMPGMQMWIPVIVEKTAEDYAAEKNMGPPAGGYPYYNEPVLPPSKPMRITP